jgi:large subunit ribosomal protein L22
MMDVHARLRFARIAPRKMRLVASTLSGLPIEEAETRLKYLAPRSAGLLLKVLRSAVANAKQNFDLDPKNLVVRNVIVGSGMTLKRTMPRARGSAYRIEKKTSHVDLVLAERTPGVSPRSGKKSPVITRKLEELSAEELSQQTQKSSAREGGPAASGAVRKPDRSKGVRRLFERRGGEK